MAANPYETYRQQDILSSGRGSLLLTLYDGCIKELKLARIHIAEKRMADANNALLKAQAILAQLASDLDMRYEISAALLQLYMFFQQELVEANVKKDGARIEPVLNMLVDLRNAWQTAVQSQRAALAAGK
jgi:flagellar protein FliS